MPRYFLDVTDGGLLHASLGENLTDADAGKVAVRIAGEIEHATELGDVVDGGSAGRASLFRIEIKAEKLTYAGHAVLWRTSPSQPTSDVRSQPDMGWLPSRWPLRRG
jgi:hypothetical protein